MRAVAVARTTTSGLRCCTVRPVQQSSPSGPSRFLACTLEKADSTHTVAQHLLKLGAAECAAPKRRLAYVNTVDTPTTGAVALIVCEVPHSVWLQTF